MFLSLELLLILRSADCTHKGGDGFTLSAKVMPPRWRIVEDSLAVFSAERGRWEGKNSREGASLVAVGGCAFAVVCGGRDGDKVSVASLRARHGGMW